MPGMSERNFRNLLEGQWEKANFLCIGLDSELQMTPESVRRTTIGETLIALNKTIVDATRDLAGAYKPNSAFYEAQGAEGWTALKETIAYIREVAPEIPVILDAKRADIGNTNNGYVRAFFDDLAADAITVHPYLGAEALAPFLERRDKGVIVLCRTSNPGSGEFQNLEVQGRPLYQVVAEKVATKWNANNNCSLVVGATYPEELAAVRAIVGDIPILIPGVGAQGGDLEKSVRAGRDARGRGFMLSVSRAISFASSGQDYQASVRAKAQEYDHAIRAALLQ
jgi:orotidine-5'-phosphate decarboxylase